MTALSVRVQPGEPAHGSSPRVGGQRTSLGWWDLCCAVSKPALVRGMRQKEESRVRASAAAVGVGTKGWAARARGPRRRKQRCSRRQR